MASTFSVGIPTLGRKEHLIEALHSIINQESKYFYDVFVLDNECDQGIENIVIDMADKTTTPVQYLPVPYIGLHNGRHAAVAASKNDVVVLVDDDIVAAPGWLEALGQAFEDSSVHLATGPIQPLYECTPPDWLKSFWKIQEDGSKWCGYLSLIDFGKTRKEIDPVFVFGANFAIRKETLLTLGGFNPDGVPWECRRYRGDGETAVSVKARAQGFKAIYQPSAQIQHKVPKERMTIEYFKKRAYLQGISDSFTAIRKNGASTELVDSKEKYGLENSASLSKTTG